MKFKVGNVPNFSKQLESKSFINVAVRNILYVTPLNDHESDYHNLVKKEFIQLLFSWRHSVSLL